MGVIKYVEIDGLRVYGGEMKSISWAKKHFLTIYYDCQAWFTDCKCRFVVKVDGSVVVDAKDVEVPTEGEKYPIPLTIGEIPPGQHQIIVEAYEGSPSYSDFQDSLTFYVDVVREEGQDQPYQNPVVYTDWGAILSDIWEQYWWAFIIGGIVIAGVVIYRVAQPPKGELEELVKLKLMKELTE